MQTIKITKIEVTEGDSPKGHWIKRLITGEDKAQFATFSPTASSLKEGDMIEADIEVKGKYTNIKEFRVLTPPSEKPKPIETPQQEVTSRQVVAIARGMHDKTDDRIAEQVALKAGIELWTMGMIKADDPLSKACYQWCCDKLGHYISPDHTGLHMEPNKPLETQGGDSQTDKDMDMDSEKAINKAELLGLVMNRMKFKATQTAKNWLISQQITQDRIDKEPKAVAKEICEKMGWN